MTLFARILKKTVVGLIVLGAIIFIPAGTFAYWRGWVFLIVFTASTTVIALYLALKDPALLERRLKAGPAAETRPLQKALVSLIFLNILALVIVSALDGRFGWSQAPAWVSAAGDVLVALGLMLNLRVLQENSYGAATVEKMEGQKLISTGPYALVRHPMYASAMIMLLGVPLALGSYWGLLFVLLTIPILVLRIFDEEKLLHDALDGYDAYALKVRYRLAPGLW